ncbi:MAG TPA: hypothetical protein VFI02_19090 [Armatimonadota bacterium]|nr:hypothetical protein [Armatimonadota bacterium]
MKRAIVLLMIVVCVSAFAADQAADKPQTVTIDVTKEEVSTVLEQVCKDTGARILLEKTADIEVSLSVTDMPLEDALTAICKPVKLSWRKIYLRADSPLLKSPESLASNLRLMAGLAFPELLVEKALDPESMVYNKQKPVVDSIPMNIRKHLGMVPLYLITNDEEAKKVKEKLDSKVEKYRKLQEEALKLFMSMTPEEREQAMALGAQQMQNMDPKLMGDMARSVMKNPEFMQRMNQQGMDMLFSMSQEDRRAMLRMQMQAQQYMTDEQKAVLMEDAKAVMAEMGINPGQPPPQQ